MPLFHGLDFNMERVPDQILLGSVNDQVAGFSEQVVLNIHATECDQSLAAADGT